VGDPYSTITPAKMKIHAFYEGCSTLSNHFPVGTVPVFLLNLPEAPTSRAFPHN